MIDWTASMKQTFEVYEVDPDTWGDVRRINNVASCSVTRDGSSSLLESATIECDEQLGECYLRIYLIANQNGYEQRFCLGTFLVQTPSSKFDGKVVTTSLDAYSPLIELKDQLPPIGYTVQKKLNIMDAVYKTTRDNLRAPVVKPSCDKTLFYPFTASSDESWLDYNTSLMQYANYSYSLDEMGRVLFEPSKKFSALKPVWIFTDDNSSILSADVSIDRDLYGIPNVVEVYFSNGGTRLSSKVVNDNPDSIISTVARGRIVMHRETNPSFSGQPTQAMIDEYARNLLESLSTLSYKVSFSHGYCPVRVGDAVQLNYHSAGLDKVNAVVTNQTIKCSTGVSVQATAIYTNKLWEANK